MNAYQDIRIPLLAFLFWHGGYYACIRRARLEAATSGDPHGLSTGIWAHAYRHMRRKGEGLYTHLLGASLPPPRLAAAAAASIPIRRRRRRGPRLGIARLAAPAKERKRRGEGEGGREGGREAHEIFIPALDVRGGGGRDNGTAIERREIKKDILDISVLQSTPHQGQRYVFAAYLREETRYFPLWSYYPFRPPPVAFWLDGCQGELYNFLQACSYFLWRGGSLPGGPG